MTVKGISQLGTFQVLNSNGAWALLFRKPLLESFRAVHDYAKDIINIPNEKKWVTLENQFANKRGIAGNLLANLTIDIKQLVNLSGDGIPSPSREVSQDNVYNNLIANKSIDTTVTAKIGETNKPSEQEPDKGWDHLWLLDPVAGNNPAHLGTEQPDISKTFEPTLLTRKTNPCSPAQVEAILAEIMIGADLTEAQHEAMHLLISEYAVCFALLMSEATAVEGAMLRLNIPETNSSRQR